MKNCFLAEKTNFKAVSLPVDLNTAALAGARIGLENDHRVAIVCNFGDSTAAVVQATLKQHTAGVGGTSKALATSNPIFKKIGAATKFTKVEGDIDAPASAFDLSADLADSEGIVIFEVLASDLDVNNGFTHVSIEFADSTAAKLFCGNYVLADSKTFPACLIDV